MQEALLQHISVKVNIMGWRHGPKAAYRQYIKNDAAVKAFVAAADSADDVSDDEVNQPCDIQTGHKTAVAGMIYARPVTEPVFSVEAKRFRLRLASMEWYAFFADPRPRWQRRRGRARRRQRHVV